MLYHPCPIPVSYVQWLAHPTFQAKDYRGAIRLYTQGIDACTSEDGGGVVDGADAKEVAALYGNRAASHVMILGYEQVMLETPPYGWHAARALYFEVLFSSQRCTSSRFRAERPHRLRSGVGHQLKGQLSVSLRC